MSESEATPLYRVDSPSFNRAGSYAISNTTSERLSTDLSWVGCTTPGGHGGLAPLNDHPNILASKFRQTVHDVNGHPLGLVTAEHAVHNLMDAKSDRQRSSLLRGYSEEHLWEATLEGDTDQVRRCLFEKNINIAFQIDSCDDNALEYKGRKITAQCIHAAAKNGNTVVLQLLLDRKAEVNAESKSVERTNDREQTRIATPIHLAAGSGGVAAVQLLLDHGASPNEAAKIDDKEHYFPIHDAVWFNQVETMKVLIKAKAKYDAVNFAAATPLHLASKLGNVKIVEYLLGSGAFDCKFQPKEKQRLLRMKDNKKKTSLDIAVSSGCLPAVKLHYFTDSFDGIDKAKAFLKVAKNNPTSVPYLLRNGCDSPEVNPGSELLEPIGTDWKTCFHKVVGETRGFGIHDLAGLINVAPQAFMDLLEILTDIPEVENPGHNPLPMRAKLPQNAEACVMACEYRPDIVWEWKRSDPDQSKKWHRDFAPLDPKRGKEVRVKVVRMKGLADLEIVYHLAVASDLRVFTKLSVHALLRYIWTRLRWIYFLDLAHEVSALVVVSLWASEKDWMLTLAAETRQTLWCIPASYAIVDLYMVLWGAVSLSGTLRAGHGIRDDGHKEVTRRRLVKKTRKHAMLMLQFLCLYPHRMIMSSLILVLVGVAGSRFQTNSDTEILLSLCVLLMWVFLLARLRAFPALGRKLLPIMRSTVQVSGMAFILLFLSLGFLHAYWSLDLDSGGSFVYEVTAFLFTGEPFQALGLLDEMGDDKRSYTVVLSIFALFIFPCCALNVFIAVLSDTYDSEQERVCCTFLQERAKICLIMFLRPKVKFGMSSGSTGRHWLVWLFYGAVIIAVSSLVYIGLLRASADMGSDGSSRYTVWASALVLAGIFLLLQGVLRASLTHKWEDLHLWFCHEASTDEISFLTAADRSISQAHDGRLTRIRTELERLRGDFKLRWTKLDKSVDDIKKATKAVRQESVQEHRDLKGMPLPPHELERSTTDQSHVSHASQPSGVSGITARTMQASESETDSRRGSNELPILRNSNGYVSGDLHNRTITMGVDSRLSLSDHLQLQQHQRDINAEEWVRQAARDINAKVEKLQNSLENVNQRLDKQEAKHEAHFTELMQICLETQASLQDVLYSARSRKKDKEKRSNEPSAGSNRLSQLAPQRLDTLSSPIAAPDVERKISQMTFGSQEQKAEQQQQWHVPPLQLPVEKDAARRRETKSAVLQPLVIPLPPPAEPPPEPQPSDPRRFGQESLVAPPQPLPPPETLPPLLHIKERPGEPPPPPPPLDA